MTIIEIYDENILNNISSSLKFNNENVIYIGYDDMNMQRGISRISRFYKSIGRDINISCIKVCRNNLPLILEELEKLEDIITNSDDEFIFDVSGGSDLLLVAIGIMAERHNLSLYTLHPVKNKIVWQQNKNNDILISNERMEISVRDNILLHGGDVVGPDNEKGTFYDWKFDKEFCRDILNMWDVCKRDSLRWNKEISELQQGLSKTDDYVYCRSNKTIESLVNIGVLVENKNRKNIYYSFKNKYIREAMMKVGNILELYVCVVAMQIKRQDGSRHFNDVKVGVNIDWDGIVHDVHDAEKDTRNEIDVVLMKGLVPVFVSCKNGDVSIDELYKLSSVAEQFGGKCAKKILICTYFGKRGASHEYFLQRARDMKILVIEDAHKLSRENLEKRLVNV